MSEQPEALRLADVLDVGKISYTGMCQAADELRRLHSVNAELLDALRSISLSVQNYRSTRKSIRLHAQAAIARADEVKP